MILVMRKPAFCICENKAADQLSSVAVQPGLCRTWSETNVDFLTSRLNFNVYTGCTGVAVSTSCSDSHDCHKYLDMLDISKV